MRLFIGIGLSEGARETLWQTVSAMGIAGRIVPRENYHLTLAFLGERDPRQLVKLRSMLTKAAADQPPMKLTINGLGFFGRRESALLHATLAKSPPLAALADRLRGMLAEAGGNLR